MIVGIGIMALCYAYYYVWMKAMPRWGNYTIRSQVLSVDDNGANTHRLIKVPNSELAQWDASHDELGRELRRRHPVGGEGVLGDSPVEKGNALDDQRNISPSESVSKA